MACRAHRIEEMRDMTETGRDRRIDFSRPSQTVTQCRNHIRVHQCREKRIPPLHFGCERHQLNQALRACQQVGEFLGPIGANRPWWLCACGCGIDPGSLQMNPNRLRALAIPGF